MTPQQPSGTQPAQPADEPSTMTPQQPSGTQPAQPADEPSTMTPQQPSGTQPSQPSQTLEPAQPAEPAQTVQPQDAPAKATQQDPSAGTEPTGTAQPAEPAAAALDFPAGSAESALLDQVKSSSSDEVGGERDDKGAWIVLDAVTFASGATTVADDSAEQLSHVAQILEENPAIKLEVGAYTDASGSARKNRQLSEERAKGVRDALIDKGIDASRIVAKGYGEANPIDTMNPESEANRRVAVRIIAR